MAESLVRLFHTSPACRSAAAAGSPPAKATAVVQPALESTDATAMAAGCVISQLLVLGLKALPLCAESEKLTATNSNTTPILRRTAQRVAYVRYRVYEECEALWAHTGRAVLHGSCGV